jgi:transcriptional regulator with XRE-family HTH domain
MHGIQKRISSMLAKTEKHTLDAAKDLRVELGLWLKALRTEQALSQRELAALLKLEYYTFISQLENGRGRIPSSRYRDWAQALGQDVRSFAIHLMSFYDPVTYEILYEDAR